MYRYSLSVFVLTLVTFMSMRPAGAQPVLTAENSLPHFLGEEVTLTQVESTSPGEVAAELMKTGENVVWDISGFTFGDTLVSTLSYQEPPFDDIAGWTVFQNIDPQPNFVNTARDIIDPEFPDTVEINFFSFADENVLANYGFGGMLDVDENGSLDEVVVANSPPEVQYPFPVSFGDTWDTEVTQQFIVVGVSQFPGATVTTTRTVTGWGMLKTAVGEAEVLQIREDRTITTFGISTTTVDYEFVGPTMSGGKNAALRSIMANFSPGDAINPVSASYSVAETEGGGNPTAAEDLNEVPGQFEIHDNYPNPFNPSTVIDYSVTNAGYATMTVHDVLGRQVGVVLDDVVSAGRHSVRWDASGLPSGMYQVRMTMGDDVRTRAVFLQK